MKAPAHKTILLIALPCCLVLAGLVVWFAGVGKDRKGNVPPQVRKVNELRVAGDHPYGNPIEGGLWWEDNLRFRNDKEYPIILWADTVKNTLFMAAYGRSAPPEIRWHHQILDRRVTWTVHRTKNRLNPGVEKVVIPGAEGLTVRSWLTVIDSDGNAVTRKLRTDRYTPMPRVIERDPAPGRGGDIQD